MDWIHVWVPAGTALRARVTLHRAWQVRVNPFDPLGLDLENDARFGLFYRPSAPAYRLFVVGQPSGGAPFFEGAYLDTLPSPPR